MKLGFIGAGNMATALARGIGEPVFVTDVLPGKAEALVELFGRAGTIVRLPKEELIEPAMALMSCGPAFMAIVAEALADAGVMHGLDPDAAAQMVVETMAGSAAVLRATNADTRGLRRRVTSPGGSTARGLAALEQAGLRAAFEEAVSAVVDFSLRR